MSPRYRHALLASALILPGYAGCDIDRHDTATGVQKQAPGTNGPNDNGTINAGGPGAKGETPK